MRNVAQFPEGDRHELFRNTADKMGLNDAIVEKDFWVCFTLDYLFHRCPWKDAITCKNCAGANFLGEGNDPAPRSQQAQEFGNAAALFPALL